MLSSKVVALAFAASALLTMPVAYADPPAQVITNGPQVDPGDHSPRWSATRNVRESQNYERLLQTNRAFRTARMRQECGPVTDPQLHSNCLASFNGNETMSGSSTPPAPISNSSGGNY